MEDQNMTQQQEEIWNNWEKNRRRSKMVGGFFVVIFGSLILAKELGAAIPDWVLTWKMGLIILGLLVGIKSSFKRPAWFFMMLIGGAFLIGDFNPELNIRPYVWPIVIILIGLAMIFKPKRRFNQRKWERWQNYHGFKGSEMYCEKKNFTSNEDHIDSNSFMGGVKKNVISKDFKGGEINNVFGGAEYNLTQADIVDTATLEINQVFGGTKLIIPPHWEIKSELTAVLGGIDDKRPLMPNAMNVERKILILKGSTFFGGIEIRS